MAAKKTNRVILVRDIPAAHHSAILAEAKRQKRSFENQMRWLIAQEAARLAR